MCHLIFVAHLYMHKASFCCPLKTGMKKPLAVNFEPFSLWFDYFINNLILKLFLNVYLKWQNVIKMLISPLGGSITIIWDPRLDI